MSQDAIDRWLMDHKIDAYQYNDKILKLWWPVITRRGHHKAKWTFQIKIISSIIRASTTSRKHQRRGED